MAQVAFGLNARPLSIALLTASFLAGLAWASPAAADPAGPAPIDFFFDLVGDTLTDVMLADEDAARRALIAGVPLTIDAREDDEAQRRMTAGANGRCSMNIADIVSVIGNARIVGTEFLDDEAPSRTVASAGADFRYAARGWKLGMKPGLEFLHEGTGFAQEDAVIEGRLSRALNDNLSVAATARYRWRESVSGESPDWEIASGRIGFASTLPHDAHMDVAYVGRQEVAVAGCEIGACQTLHSLGPSVGLAVPLRSSLDLSANYDFTSQTSYVDAVGGQLDSQTDDELHRLSLALTWALGGDPDAMQLSAAYRFEHGGADQEQESRHAGTVSLAVYF
jgi:hypothetical protein